MKLFGTDGIRGKAGEYPITAEVAEKLAKAAVQVLAEKNPNPHFVIGKDTRESGQMLEDALVAGLTRMGASVTLLGIAPTPVVAFAVRKLEADAGIVISASHNPYTDNGIKFFDNEGFKLPDEIEEKIETLTLKGVFNESKSQGSVTINPEPILDYIEFAVNSVDLIDLSGTKIVLDCANGAAHEIAPQIFTELGATVIALNTEPTGVNINKNCGAVHPEMLQDAVKKEKADIGIALDGDADRIMLVDEKGTLLDGDYVLAIAMQDMISNNTLKNNSVVVTHYTNLAFDKLAEKHDASVSRVQNGDRYVIEEMRKSGSNLGGEYTGHIIFSDLNPTGDGTMAGLQITKILKKSGKKLSELANALQKYPQVVVSVSVSEKKPLEDLEAVQQAIAAAEEELGSEGRHLVRYSGTEMKARVMVESPDKEITNKLAHKIADEIKRVVG